LSGQLALEPKTISGKIIGFGFSIISMLVLSCYTANLATVLIASNNSNIVSDISDRLDVVYCVNTDDY